MRNSEYVQLLALPLENLRWRKHGSADFYPACQRLSRRVSTSPSTDEPQRLRRGSARHHHPHCHHPVADECVRRRSGTESLEAVSLMPKASLPNTRPIGSPRPIKEAVLAGQSYFGVRVLSRFLNLVS